MLNSEGIQQRGVRSAPYQNAQRMNNGGVPIRPAQPNAAGQANSGQQTVAESNNNPNTPPPARGKKRLLLVAVVALIVLLIGLAGFFAWKYFTSDGEDNSNEETTAKIIERVGNLFALPEGEEPTVAQIQDRAKLQDQEFFDRARNDDYLLVYEEAKVALLYRQSEDKLINVGPISAGQEPQSEDGRVSGEQTP